MKERVKPDKGEGKALLQAEDAFENPVDFLEMIGSRLNFSSSCSSRKRRRHFFVLP